MRILYLNIHGQTGGLLSKLDEIEHLAITHKADIFVIAEAELPENSTIPVIENFTASKSYDVPSRLVTYVRSDLPVDIKPYHDSLPAMIITMPQSSFAFIYSQFTDNAYNENR